MDLQYCVTLPLMNAWFQVLSFWAFATSKLGYPLLQRLRASRFSSVFRGFHSADRVFVIMERNWNGSEQCSADENQLQDQASLKRYFSCSSAPAWLSEFAAIFAVLTLLSHSDRMHLNSAKRLDQRWQCYWSTPWNMTFWDQLSFFECHTKIQLVCAGAKWDLPRITWRNWCHREITMSWT